ncbi:hypothetical protein M3Y98_00789100 [Aphelenchoides besseyi]|nr:hypothetical protein M3Y98_00789100 [Aphelenchoides besseyi]KAI6211913.1 hypothetical protein M3Y96_00484700 [Aphelenchoides besseyi]
MLAVLDIWVGRVPKHFQFGSVELPTNSNCTSNSTYSIETHQSSATIFPSSSTTNPTISIAPFTTLNSVIAPAAPILQTPTVNTTASANTTETGGAMSTSGGGATMICPTDLHAAYLASLSSNPDFAAFLAQQQLANGGHLPLGASTSTSPQTAVGSIQQQPQMSAAAAMAMKAAGAQVNTQSAPASQKPSFNLGSFNGPDMMKLYAQNPQAAAAGLKMPIGMTPQFMIPQLEAAAGKKTPIAAAKDAQQPRASPTTSTSAATASNPPSSQQLNGDAAAQLHFQQQQAAVAQSNALKRSLPNSMMQNYQEQLMATMNGPSPAKRHSISALPGALPPGLANGHVPLSLGGPSLMLTNPAAAAALNPQFALMAAQLNGGIGGAMPKLQVPTTAHPTNAQPSGVLSIATVPPSYVHTTPVSRNGSASADNANGSTAQPTVSQPVVTMPNGVQMPILNLPDGTPFSPQQFFLLQQAQLQAAAQQHIQKAAQQQILSGQTLQSPNVQQTNQTAPPDPNNPNLMNRQAHILANAHHRHLPLNPQMQMAQNQMVQQQQQAQQQAQAAHQQRLNGQQAAAQASQTMPPPNAMLNSYQIMQLFGQQQQLPAVAASAASNSITSLPTVSATNSNTLQNGPLVPPMMMYNSLTQQQAMLQAQQQLQMQAAAQQHQQASALAEQRRRASNAGLQNTPLNPSGASQMSMMAPFFAANGPSQLPLGSQLAALTAASIQATQPQPSFVQHPTPISLTTIGQQPRASPLSNSTAAAAIGSPTTRQPVTTTAVPTSTSGTPSQPSSLPAGWTNLIANLNSQQKEELAKLFQNATSQSSATTSSIPASSSDSTAPVIDPIVTTVESTSTVSPVRQSPITTITIQSPVAVTVSTPSSSNVPVVVTSSEETIPSEPQPQVVEDEENPVVD